MTGKVMCSDNRFEIIAKAKKDILESTNIDTSPEEMAVLDNFLFRCWQMGWLRKYEPAEVKESYKDMIGAQNKTGDYYRLENGHTITIQMECPDGRESEETK